MTDSERELLASIGMAEAPVVWRWPLPLAASKGAKRLALASVGLLALYGLPHGPLMALLTGLIGATALLGSLVAHEYGHLLLGRYARGVTPRLVLLRGFGGVAVCEGRYQDARGAALFAVGGPLATVASLAVTAVPAFLIGGPVGSVLRFVVFLNLLVLAANLLPLAPMDGYMLLRSWLWARAGDRSRGEHQAMQASKALLGLGVLVVALLCWREPSLGVMGFLALAAFVTQHQLAARQIAAHRRAG